MVQKGIVTKILKAYGKAWVAQDAEKILTIFAKNAKYQERSFEKPLVGHTQIKKYWQEKVIRGQKEIKFRLLNIYIDADTVVAEWDASFVDTARNEKVHIREVAILEIEEGKIKSLREYWHREP